MKVVCGVLGILLTTLVFAHPVRAETITLTSGALVWNGTGNASVTLAGGSFTFAGSAAPLGGIFTPGECRSFPECVAGGTVDLFSRWVGLDIPGTATYNGQTYTQVGGLNSPTSLDARWTGTLAIPSSFTGGTLTAPFQFGGEFFYPETPGARAILNLLGAGTATLNFTPFVNQPGAFSLTSLRYDIEAAPVPEPTSMLLIGTGLAGLAAVRRRRQGLQG